MSPEYEGPEDEEQDAVAPRRVKHLIVLPGGGVQDEAIPVGPATAAPASLSPRSETGSEWEWEPDHDDLEPVAGSDPVSQTGQIWNSGVAARGGASAAAAQVAETMPLDAPPAQSLRLKLRVISKSVTSTKAPGMPFIIFASVLVSGAIFGLVLLRVMVDQASFRVDSLDSQVTKQQAQLRQLRYAVSVQEAPGRIASLASQAGLVPGSQMQTLVGAGQSAPTATAAASPSASPSQSPRSQTPQAPLASPPAPPASASPASGGTGPPAAAAAGLKAKATTTKSAKARTATKTAPR